MKHEGSIALFQYWNRLRNGRPAPRRTEIEPADIKTLLADTFILEKDARGEPVFRLAGTRLCALYGRELKGFSFASLWREKDQRLLSRLAEGSFGSKSIVVVSYEGVSRNGRTNAFVDPDREPVFLSNRPALTVPNLVPTAADLGQTRAPGPQGRRIRHLVVLDGGREE